MKTPLILTYDIGTQSARAMLVNQYGEIVAKKQIKFAPPYFSTQPNWAEQHPEVYWDTLCEASLSLKESCGELWSQIIAVTCTTIRDSCLCIDKDLKPLRDVILWLDKREAINLPPIKFFPRLIFAIINMSESVALQRKISACNWIKANQPEIWAKTYKFIMLSTYMNIRLVGKTADSIANMVGHIPFDSKSRGWMKESNLKRVIFNVEQSKLVDIVEPGDIVGTITKEAALATGLPVGMELIATGSDKGCETLGLSVTTNDKAAISFGTTATIQMTTSKYMEPLPFIPAYPAVLNGKYNPEVQIYRGYWLISWFKKEFASKEVEEARLKGVAPEDLLNARLREIPAGCDGLIFQPYFTPGVVMPKARGAIVGFSDIHSRIHIYRAIIEGLNFALMDGMRTMERRGKLKIKEIYVGGGGSQSDEICQITANMFGLPVLRIQTHEASGLGSSMIAFIAKGIFANAEEAIASMVHISSRFLPDEDEHQLYEKIFKDVFCKIFPRLLPLYKKSFK